MHFLVKRWQLVASENLMASCSFLEDTFPRIDKQNLFGLSWHLTQGLSGSSALVPALGGPRFSRESDYHPRPFDYRMERKAQFLLIHGKRGGQRPTLQAALPTTAPGTVLGGL